MVAGSGLFLPACPAGVTGCAATGAPGPPPAAPPRGKLPVFTANEPRADAMAVAVETDTHNTTSAAVRCTSEGPPTRDVTRSRPGLAEQPDPAAPTSCNRSPPPKRFLDVPDFRSAGVPATR